MQVKEPVAFRGCSGLAPRPANASPKGLPCTAYRGLGYSCPVTVYRWTYGTPPSPSTFVVRLTAQSQPASQPRWLRTGPSSTDGPPPSPSTFVVWSTAQQPASQPATVAADRIHFYRRSTTVTIHMRGMVDNTAASQPATVAADPDPVLPVYHTPSCGLLFSSSGRAVVVSFLTHRTLNFKFTRREDWKGVRCP